MFRYNSYFRIICNYDYLHIIVIIFHTFLPKTSISIPYTVEPLSNDHPHQRPSLLYDHILCDGQFCLFERSLTDDHPSDATNDRVRWDFLSRERPPRLQCISKNRWCRFNIRSQWWIITMFIVVPRHLSSNSFILATTLQQRFSDRRCIVSMLPARRRSDTFAVGLIQVL